jgi:disulfide bond formation protein DsbB
MTYQKILGLVALAISIVGAFVAIPYIGLILLVIGLIIGFSIAGEHHVRVIVSAIALSMFAGAFSAVPAVGTYLQTIVTNIGALAAGAALSIILLNIYNRFKP